MNTEVNNLTTEQLEAMLAERKKAQLAEKEELRKNYESRRDKLATDLVKSAISVNQMLAEFKTNCFSQMGAMHEAALEYGDVRKHSKGGFSIRSADGTMMAKLCRNVVHEYDERADIALALIAEFLETTIKKKDVQTYRTISTLLEKNKDGKLDPARVASLLKIKDNYADAGWIKAMELLPESYRQREVSYNVEFYQKDELGKDQSICLTFSSIPVAAPEQAEAEQ